MERYLTRYNRPWADLAADLRASGEYAESALADPQKLPTVYNRARIHAVFAFGYLGQPSHPDGVPDLAHTRRAADHLQKYRDEYGPVGLDVVNQILSVAFNARDYVTAQRIAEDWRAAAPADPTPHARLADIAFHTEAYGPAVRDAEKAISLIGPKSPDGETIKTESVGICDEARAKLK